MKRATLLLAFLANAAFAQDQQRSGPPAGWSAGVLGMAMSSPYVSADDDLLVVPLVQYEGDRLYFRGLRLGYEIGTGRGWSAAVIAQPRLLHLDREDFAFETNIRDRDRSLDLGVIVERRFGPIRAELLALTDVLGRSNGQEASARFAWPLRFGPVAVSPDVTVRFWSDALMDYYAGVEADEVLREELVYDPDAAVVPEAGLTARIPLSRTILLAAQYRHRFLTDDFTDSPLIEEDYERSFFLGLTYAWSRR